MYVRGQRLGRQLLECRDIRDENSAPVCSDNEVVLARVNLQIVDRLCRHIALHSVPLVTAVDRHVHRQLCSHKQQVGILAILPDHVDRLVRQVGRDRRPGLTIIRRLVNEWPEIIAPVTGVGDVRRAGIVMGCLYPAHPVLRVSPDAVVELGPVFPAVTRELNISVVRSHPNHAGHDW